MNQGPKLPGSGSAQGGFPPWQGQGPGQSGPVGPSPGAGPDEVFEEDFTDETGEGNFKLVPDGKYYAKVIDIEKGFSKANNPQYIWKFVVTAGEHQGHELRAWTALTTNARWKVVRWLTNLGIRAAGSVARFTRGEVVGKPCILNVIIDDWDGKDVNSVEELYPADQGAMQAASNTPNY